MDRAARFAPVHRAASDLRIGGFVPFSSVDFPGEFAAVVFVQGCPWRCTYCHNPHLQRRDRLPDDAHVWPALHAWMERRVALVDAIVFSGGEPTVDPALAAAVSEVRELGFRVGLHTAGLYPRRLQPLLPQLGWVGLDVKAPLAGSAAVALHARITGTRSSPLPVRRSLGLLVASGVDFECRTTVHPALLDDAALLAVADDLADAGVRRWALQIYRATGSLSGLAPVGDDYPSIETLARLRSRIPGLTVRRH